MASIVIEDLTVEERIELIDRLWASLDHEMVPLSDAQREELKRRIGDDDANPEAAAPWDEVEARLRQRLR